MRDYRWCSERWKHSFRSFYWSDHRSYNHLVFSFFRSGSSPTEIQYTDTIGTLPQLIKAGLEPSFVLVKSGSAFVIILNVSYSALWFPDNRFIWSFFIIIIRRSRRFHVRIFIVSSTAIFGECMAFGDLRGSPFLVCCYVIVAGWILNRVILVSDSRELCSTNCRGAWWRSVNIWVKPWLQLWDVPLFVSSPQSIWPLSSSYSSRPSSIRSWSRLSCGPQLAGSFCGGKAWSPSPAGLLAVVALWRRGALAALRWGWGRAKLRWAGAFAANCVRIRRDQKWYRDFSFSSFQRDNHQESGILLFLSSVHNSDSVCWHFQSYDQPLELSSWRIESEIWLCKKMQTAEGW